MGDGVVVYGVGGSILCELKAVNTLNTLCDILHAFHGRQQPVHLLCCFPSPGDSVLFSEPLHGKDFYPESFTKGDAALTALTGGSASDGDCHPGGDADSADSRGGGSDT